MGALLKAHTNCDEGWCFVREGCAWAEQQQRDWDKCAAPQRSRPPPAPAEPKTEPAHQIVEQAAPTAAQEARPPFERTRIHRARIILRARWTRVRTSVSKCLPGLERSGVLAGAKNKCARCAYNTARPVFALPQAAYATASALQHDAASAALLARAAVTAAAAAAANRTDEAQAAARRSSSGSSPFSPCSLGPPRASGGAPGAVLKSTEERTGAVSMRHAAFNTALSAFATGRKVARRGEHQRRCRCRCRGQVARSCCRAQDRGRGRGQSGQGADRSLGRAGAG